jgi:hypothetical protein
MANVILLLVEQELPNLPEHMISSPVFSGVRVTRSLVLCVCFVDRCLSFYTFYFGHCVVSSSSIYRFWLPLWNLLVIVLSVLLRYTDSDYPFGIFWQLHCQFFFHIRFWLPLWYLVVIVSSALLRYTDSDYPFGICWPSCRLLFFDIEILITALVSFGHHVVISSSIYWFWLLFWYHLAIVLSVLLRYTDSDYPFGIIWPLCCQFFFDIQILITL